MSHVLTIEHREHKIEVAYDEEPTNPREFDNVTTILGWHGRYDIGDGSEVDADLYGSWDELEEAVRDHYKPVFIRRLYMLDHSGLALSMEGFANPWDSGQVGFVLITKDRAEATGVTRQFWESAAQGELETYQAYLNGWVYAYTIESPEGEFVDSCSGYFERDYMIEEAKEIVNGLADARAVAAVQMHSAERG